VIACAAVKENGFALSEETICEKQEQKSQYLTQFPLNEMEIMIDLP
jgi:hypothetical protein